MPEYRPVPDEREGDRADGDLVVHDADAAGTLARSFPRRETFLPEQF